MYAELIALIGLVVKNKQKAYLKLLELWAWVRISMTLTLCHRRDPPASGLMSQLGCQS